MTSDIVEHDCRSYLLAYAYTSTLSYVILKVSQLVTLPERGGYVLFLSNVSIEDYQYMIPLLCFKIISFIFRCNKTK
jgi:hypothetical protein